MNKIRRREANIREKRKRFLALRFSPIIREKRDSKMNQDGERGRRSSEEKRMLSIFSLSRFRVGLRDGLRARQAVDYAKSSRRAFSSRHPPTSDRDY